MKFRKFLGLVISSQMALSTLAFAETSQVQMWKESGITFQSTVGGLIYPNCNSSLSGFAGCIATLDVFARSFETPVMILPASLVGDPDVLQGEKWKFWAENFWLVKVPKYPEQTPYQASQRQKKEDIKISNAQKEIFERLAREGKTIDFEKAFFNFYERMKSNKKNAGKLEFLLGMAVNEGLKFQEDPHTRLAPTASFKEAGDDKVITGVGIVFSEAKNSFVVDSLARGGAAEASGKIKKGDVLVAIKNSTNWKNVAGQKLEEITSQIRGVENTQVSLRFQRGGVVNDVILTRKKITFPNVDMRELKDFNTSYGYIRLGSFMDDKGCRKIRDGIHQFEAQNVKGLILDLRGNGGGLLTQAECISGLFVGPKNIVGIKYLHSEEPIEYQKSLTVEALEARNRRDEKISLIGKGQGAFSIDEAPIENELGIQQTKLPLVVLINGESASASEIVSGALQDYKAAWLVGEKSFGKATAQKPTESSEFPKLSLVLTNARFYQPSGRTNQVVGIQPDFVVPYKPGATDEERFSPREEDLYVNPLPPEGPKWSQSRTSDVARIESCRQSQHWAEDKFKRVNPETDEEPDYQRWVAEEILSCAGAH